MSENLQYASKPPPNKAALWSMVLGISGVVLSLAAIGGVLGILAVVLGIMGVIKPGRKGMSITGITTGVLSLPVAFIAFFIWAGFLVAYVGRAGHVTMAKTHATEAELSNIRQAVFAYEVDNGAYPDQSDGLQALITKPPTGGATWRRYMMDLPKDPWGTDIEYKCPGIHNPQGFDLISAGPDRTFGTADDIFR